MFSDEIQLRELPEENQDDVPKQQETVEKNINYDEWDSLIADMKK